MSILKQKRIKLTGIKKIAILADLACRKEWKKNFTPLLKKVWDEHKPQLFLVAGDLALNASDSEYREVLQAINSVPAQWIAVPGDHDRPLKNFIKYFGSTRKVIDIEKWRFIGINTSNRMFLKREREWIDSNIKANSIIFSHLPPEAEGWTFHSFWPKSSNNFLEVVKKYRTKIHSMFFGHIHGYSRREYLGIPMIVTGAVAESRIVKNNRYSGDGFFEMMIFDVKTGKISMCKQK